MNPEITLITPMFNESGCIKENIKKIINSLQSLGVSWEYILINDGSTDDSYAIARECLAEHPNSKLIHYSPNRGRGYALRQGFDAAMGKYVITTESDLSWGADVISDLYNALKKRGDDIVIASTHMPEGGYENVPLFRRRLSSIGNRIIRHSFGGNLTMLSGMTRGYRRESIQSIYLEEDDKEIHLEIITKAQLLGLRISEIPGRIQWSSERKAKGFRKHIKIAKHIIPHLLSSISTGAFRIISIACILLLFAGAGLAIFGILNKLFSITPTPKPNIVTYGLLLVVLSIITFLLSVLSLQLLSIKKGIVHLQSQIKRFQKEKPEK